jgi:TolA-binding protein
MTERDPTERAQELSQLWQSQAVRLEEPAEPSERRHKIVPTVAAAIARAAERRRHERNLRRVLGALALAAGVAATFGVVKFTGAQGPAARSAEVAIGDVRAVSGVVSLVHDAQAHVVDRASLVTGDTLSMAPSSRAEVRLSNLVVADIGGSSEVLVAPAKGATHRLRLDRGRLEAKVDDRPTQIPKLVVETPDVEVVVTGTVFAVDVSNPEPQRTSITHVSVDKGRVVVRREGKDIAAVSAGETWSSEATTSAVAAQAPGVEAPAAPVERPQAATSGSDPVALGTLANENRLFRNAIDARNRGDDRAAIAGFNELLSKYPKSLLAGEARVERIRALVRSGDKQEAAKEARRYMSDYPNGFALEEARHVATEGGGAQ